MFSNLQGSLKKTTKNESSGIFSSVKLSKKKIDLAKFFFSEIVNFYGFLIHFVGCCVLQQSLKLVWPPPDFSSMFIIIATEDAKCPSNSVL